MSIAIQQSYPLASKSSRMLDWTDYWCGWPLRWLYQMGHNGHGIVRVLDITKFRPFSAGMVGLDHPWVTGINPATNKPIWNENVIYRSARTDAAEGLEDDETVVYATGKFLAERVRQSAVVPELPVGPKRRMPHAINYLHGVSHYNSGILVMTDLEDGYRHITDRHFRRELKRFVRKEQREVLFVFRNREYSERDYAYFSCCMRTVFPWFCNPNGPKKKVLWGNAAPFPAANLITGRWVNDLYRLKKPGGAEAVAKSAIAKDRYFMAGPYDTGRDQALWPEKLLALGTYWRVRMRGNKGGMFFVDRRKVYADQIQNRVTRGKDDEPQARF